ncbi:hypothetical protein AB0D45_12545 [Streptomyces sp. NPDC048352]|uniref:hypothetical protein n=1 Tax=Streptomyces sp. NPDC048352 TaxID=3154718 RepID=UPI003426FDC1
MSEQERHHRSARTTPSQAPGESGDRAARRAADEAVAGEAGDTGRDQDGGHDAKRQRPGLGREEQVSPYPEPSGTRPEQESDDR